MENEAFVESAWAGSEAAVRAMLESGADAFLKAQPDFSRAFEPRERTCSCIDERVAGPKLAIPGSGILFADSEKAAVMMRAIGVTKISSHEHCGAARLAYKTTYPDQEPTSEQVNAFAEEWTKAFAEQHGFEYAGQKPVEGGDQHVARVIYYDATETFDPSALPELPSGFLVSRFSQEPLDTVTGVTLAAAIAMGDHGFGSRFTVDSPLLIVPVGNSEDLPQLRKEISDAFKNSDLGDRIHVDQGIISPAGALAQAA